ncbi:MAG: hypothetical protein ACI9BD_000084, partial [Candidatus Marinamargulisbacteria bacterium]
MLPSHSLAAPLSDSYVALATKASKQASNALEKLNQVIHKEGKYSRLTGDAYAFKLARKVDRCLEEALTLDGDLLNAVIHSVLDLVPETAEPDGPWGGVITPMLAGHELLSEAVNLRVSSVSAALNGIVIEDPLLPSPQTGAGGAGQHPASPRTDFAEEIEAAHVQLQMEAPDFISPNALGVTVDTVCAEKTQDGYRSSNWRESFTKKRFGLNSEQKQVLKVFHDAFLAYANSMSDDNRLGDQGALQHAIDIFVANVTDPKLGLVIGDQLGGRLKQFVKLYSRSFNALYLNLVNNVIRAVRAGVTQLEDRTLPYRPFKTILESASAINAPSVGDYGGPHSVLIMDTEFNNIHQNADLFSLLDSKLTEPETDAMNDAALAFANKLLRHDDKRPKVISRAPKPTPFSTHIYKGRTTHEALFGQIRGSMDRIETHLRE